MVLLIKTFCQSDFKYEKVDKLIEFVLEKLQESGTNLGKKLFTSLKYRANQRKISIVSEAINFLNSEKTGEASKDIIRFKKETHNRLFASDYAETIEFVEEEKISDFLCQGQLKTSLMRFFKNQKKKRR